MVTDIHVEPPPATPPPPPHAPPQPTGNFPPPPLHLYRKRTVGTKCGPCHSACILKTLVIKTSPRSSENKRHGPSETDSLAIKTMKLDPGKYPCDGKNATL
ncbi:unnamed protein product [Gadus morhua 'NCC']